MQLEQAFILPFARATVWPAFADVPMLVSCMPGAALQGEPRVADGGADIDLIFTVKLGPITGAFLGNGAVRRDDAGFAGSVTGNGADRKSGSRVKGEAKFAVTETSAAETRVVVNVDYSLTGSLAQFSRGAIVKELATALTRDFADSLQQRIAASQAEAVAIAGVPESTPAVAGTSAAPSPPPPPPAQSIQSAPLNAGRLFWRVLWARVSGWFNRTAS